MSGLRSRLLKKHFRSSKKRIVRYGLLAANATLLIAVIGFVSSSPNTSEVAVNYSLNNTSADSEIAANPLDQLSSADIAVQVARLTQLDETTAVINHADSVNSQLAVTPVKESIVAKPQIVATELKSKKDIFTYSAESNDSVSSLATRFGVTSDSIRWSNALREERLEPGQEILIPPTNGIVYTVKEGDTIDGLVQRYSANKQKLIEMNDAEVEGLKIGDRIIIPDGIQPSRSVFGGGARGGSIVARYGGNGYDYGWCTWHAANRRIETGRPLPTNLGNAITWYSQAQRAGLPVGNQPQAGAVIWHANIGGLGHVAFVERINEDGSILVSDMNYPYWGRVTYRTVQPGEFSKYRFVY